MLVVNPFWWKAYVPFPFARLYSVDDLMICISVSHATCLASMINYLWHSYLSANLAAHWSFRDGILLS